MLSSSDCHWSYMGDTGRGLQERQKEHSRAIRDMDVDRSEIAKCVMETRHRMDPQAASVIDKQSDWHRRVIKEAVWTKKLFVQTASLMTLRCQSDCLSITEAACGSIR